MRFWRQTLLIARNEWGYALRSRRALAVLTLYVAVAALTMNGLLSALLRLERELGDLLRLSAAPAPGAVVDALWNSARFRQLVAGALGSESLAAELVGVSPVALAFAGLAFFYAPLLVALLAPARVAEELGRGALRFVAVRAPLLAWSLGKFLGQVLLVGAGLGFSALTAWAIAVYRLPGADSAAMGSGLAAWTLRVWLYAAAFVGLTMGAAHLTRSPSRAILVAVLALLVVAVASWGGGRLAESRRPAARTAGPLLRALAPPAYRADLWRRSAAHLAPAAAGLAALALCYLLAGYALRRRRDL